MNIAGYVIDKQIGQGGMAMVYRATQESLGRPVALKVMNPLFSDTPEFSERFLDEGRLLAAVHHSNIITIHDIGISDGFHFISMEYVEGGDLGDRIKAGISPSQAMAYVETLAECLAVAHDLHIVHRDIKPANILFRKDETLLLTDFGIAKQLTTNKELTATGAMVGSPSYLSPEQAQGNPVDGRSDIYSLGVLYYEMLTGEKPFVGKSGVDIAIKHVTQPLPALPDALAAYSGIIECMTHKDPDERFPSCRSLAVALREFRETGAWSEKIADIPLPALTGSEAVATGVTPADAAETSVGGTVSAVGRPEDAASRHDGAGQTMAGTTDTQETLVLDDAAGRKGEPIGQEGPPVTPMEQGGASPDNGASGEEASLVEIAPTPAATARVVKKHPWSRSRQHQPESVARHVHEGCSPSGPAFLLSLRSPWGSYSAITRRSCRKRRRPLATPSCNQNPTGRRSRIEKRIAAHGNS